MQSFVEIGSPVLDKKSLDIIRVFTIYGHGGHLGHVTWIIYIHIGSHFLRMLHINFGFDWLSGFREKKSVYGRQTGQG